MAHASHQPFQFSLGSLFRLTAGVALLVWLIPLYPLVQLVLEVYLGGTLILIGLISLLYVSALAMASIYDACTRLDDEPALLPEPIHASSANASRNNCKLLGMPVRGSSRPSNSSET